MERELNTLHAWIQNCQKLASHIELQPLPVLSPAPFSNVWIALNFQYKEHGHWKWPTWMVTRLSWMTRILSLLTCLIWGLRITCSLQASKMLQNCCKLPRETPSSSDVSLASAVESLLSSYSKSESESLELGWVWLQNCPLLPCFFFWTRSWWTVLAGISVQIKLHELHVIQLASNTSIVTIVTIKHSGTVAKVRHSFTFLACLGASATLMWWFTTYYLIRKGVGQSCGMKFFKT